MKPDYTVHNIDTVDSPAVLVYPPIIKRNIELAVKIAGGPVSLRPHVKTHKMVEITAMLLESGINKFKCATIAEAEMLVMAGATDILLAYQPTAVKAARLAKIAEANPGTTFGYLVDNAVSASVLDNLLSAPNLMAWIDVNVGMNRTGVAPENVKALFSHYNGLSRRPAGLHAYDGHIHDTDLALRFQQAEIIYKLITGLASDLRETGTPELKVVIGGTPCFPYYARKKDVETSPGTFVFWDRGYSTLFPDMKFEIAAILLTRVISVIDSKRICLDLGHKSVAAEGPLPRVYFPDHPDAKVLGQSEEHLVVEVDDSSKHLPGEVWYGIPQHICPTVALYESVQVVEDNEVKNTWQVVARNRKIWF